uniref:A-amastin n=1 Tax=Angomonas deanei TaxID=59799 RepID=C6K3T5_9TRYP|nr:a-amastin [Angomonas deanei]
MMHGSGNTVPQGQHQNGPESDSESYTGSSGSYTESVSQNAPPQQQQQQQQAAPQSASKSKRTDHAQPASHNNRHAAPQQFDEGDDDEHNDQNKGQGRSGKDKARHMVNAALNAPAARMRAVSASLAGRDSQRVTIYVFFCVAFIHLLFIILSCTLSQIDVQGGGCYTFWGYKANCDDVSYTIRTSLIKNCGQLRSTLQTGAAFSIMSILTSTGIFFLAWMLCGRLRHANYIARHQKRYQNVDGASMGNDGEGNNKNTEQTFNAGQLKLVTIIVVAISLAFELIAWAVIAGIDTQHYCDDVYHLSTTGTYGVGFGLGLTAWILEIIVYVVYIVVV